MAVDGAGATMSDDEHIDIQCNRVDTMACGQCGKHLDVSQLPPFSLITCPACNTEQTVPALLGQFLLVQQLGAGGMGAVYRAVDQALGRFVAIKVMKKALGDDRELVESFLREARAAAALNHPNIVQIYSCGQEKGQPYIVMELVGGGRLDLMMEGNQKVDEVRLLQVALDVAEGLKAANGANLVHGDIKPANILFDKSGTAKVVDFGLAQFVNRQQEQGGVWGTPYYISPERARGGKADHRSDIYSLGATMFHALTGHAPFEGKTAADVVVARLKAPPPKIRDLEPALQPETASLIERMMAADPVLRYPTSASLLADMRHALHAAREARSVTGRARKRPKKEWGHLVVLGVTLLVLLVVGVAVIRWFRAGTQAPAPAPAATRPPPRPAAPATTPDTEGVTVEKTEDGKLKMTVEFFTGDAEKAVADAAAALAGDQPMQMYERLEAFSTNVPKNSARFMWVRVLQAVPLRVAGDDAQADKLLREVAALPIRQRAGHPLYMPQVLAQYMIGDLSEDRFARERSAWPAWYGDLARFVSGLKVLLKGDLDGGAAALEGFAASKRDTPAWVYALQPAAQRWLETIAGWEERKKQVAATINGGDLAAATAELDRLAALSPAFMKPDIEAMRDRVRQAEERVAGRKFEAQERERRKVVQQDLDLLDEVMGTNVTLIVGNKDFRKVQQVITKAQAGLQTPEGKARAKILREHLDRMDALKTLLIKELEGNPFRQADAELGGEAIGANVLGVRVSAAGRGTVTRPWDQISPRVLVRLLGHAIGGGGRDAKAQADLYLSLAVLCVYNGGYEPAANFAKQAVDLDPSAAPTARRLMPDVLTEG